MVEIKVLGCSFTPMNGTYLSVPDITDHNDQPTMMYKQMGGEESKSCFITYKRGPQKWIIETPDHNSMYSSCRQAFDDCPYPPSRGWWAGTLERSWISPILSYNNDDIVDWRLPPMISKSDLTINVKATRSDETEINHAYHVHKNRVCMSDNFFAGFLQWTNSNQNHSELFLTFEISAFRLFPYILDYLYSASAHSAYALIPPKLSWHVSLLWATDYLQMRTANLFLLAHVKENIRNGAITQYMESGQLMCIDSLKPCIIRSINDHLLHFSSRDMDTIGQHISYDDLIVLQGNVLAPRIARQVQIWRLSDLIGIFVNHHAPSQEQWRQLTRSCNLPYLSLTACLKLPLMERRWFPQCITNRKLSGLETRCLDIIATHFFPPDHLQDKRQV
jgi:hypothetical protein